MYGTLNWNRRKYKNVHLRVVGEQWAVAFVVHPEREESSLSRAERWLFGLLFASTLGALAQQVLVARHFAERMPEIAERVRHWFTAAV